MYRGLKIPLNLCGRNSKKKVTVCFICYRKGFDCVECTKLWNVLTKMKVPEYLIVFMRKLYTGQESTIWTLPGETDWVHVGKGV